MPARVLLGLILSACIGYAGYRRGALSASGVLGAVLVGTAVFGFGGPAWGAVLVVFFASSSALSRYRQAQKESLAEKFSKGAQRDLWQALANGGLGALIAMIYALHPAPWLWPAFLGAMAGVNADTWATELGVLAPTPPRLITTGRPVEVGTSGGVSLRGSAAALAGAALIGALGAAYALGVDRAAGSALALLYAVTLGGLLASLFDSLLGASVQRIYYCDHCRKETERRLHRCGNITRPLRGWGWLDNDWVNFLSSGVGAIAATGLWGTLF